MNKLLLIDGNSMLFRAYYGTLSRGYMKSNSGVVTNAVYGFSTMLNKAIEIINPTHILVAFDTKDKTFRHKMFDDYKGTRKEVDEELISQFSLVREFLDAYPIKRFELSGFEADDIIGTMSRMYPDSKIEILTSDRDMLQLIDDNVDVLLMKKGLTDLRLMNKAGLMEEMGIVPSQIVDMKALMGDSSDNIPGVPSIGEKTALKLLGQYNTFDNLYAHKDEIKGKMGEKIREFEDQARMSYQLAEICTSVPLKIELDSIKYEIPNDTLNAFYRKYDMNSLITEDYDVEFVEKKNIVFVELDRSWVDQEVAFSLDIDKKGTLVGCYISNGVENVYLSYAEMLVNPIFKDMMASPQEKVIDSSKSLYRFCLENNFKINKPFDDLLLLAFIVNSSTTTMERFKDEFALWFHEYEGLEKGAAFAQNILTQFRLLKEQALALDVVSVYDDIEKPLVPILAKCEFKGINVDRSVLDDIAESTHQKIEVLSNQVYELAGMSFNLNSPKQLAEVLFDHLKLPTKKKRSTAVDVLEGLVDEHEIIAPILEYRKYQKLYSTYAVGLTKHIHADGKIHTTFNQHATQTGRLSSSDPNLQNISVRDEETRMIRKAFVASEGCTLMSIDYSQIELRVLSYLADEQRMMEAFNGGHDIHAETAKAIFGVDEITSTMRRQAKSVNFGIVYGMSEYGLSKQLDITIPEARHFINRYNEIYPNITKYMDSVVEDCIRDGYVKTLFNRRRYIPEIYDKNRAVKDFGKRAAMNAPIQGTAADIIKIAMLKADELLEANNFKSSMILQVHDELVFDVYDDELEKLQELMVSVMEHIVSWPIDLKVSVDTGKDWY